MCLRRFKHFCDGKETTEDEPRSGQPSTSRTPDMIERVQQMLAQDRQVILRLMAEELGISKGTVHNIVHEDLCKRKICSWFVPHKLIDEQKAKRMETSGDFITMCDKDPSFLRTIITGDETWCHQFDLESKRQSMEWRSPSSPQPKKSRLQKSKVKTVLIAFFDSYGIIHKEFVPAGQTVNSAFCEDVLKQLLWRIHRVQPELHRTGQWMLLPDNAPAHCAIRVHQFLAQRGVPVLDHPLYSPDLAPADFFLIPRLKSIMKGAHFADVAAIQERVTAVLHSIPKETFADSFQKLYEHCQQCVVKDCDYFEGQ